MTAAEIKIRAERKAGELLREMSPGRGGDRKSSDTMSLDLEGLGIHKKQSSRWQTIAAADEADYLPITSATIAHRMPPMMIASSPTTHHAASLVRTPIAKEIDGVDSTSSQDSAYGFVVGLDK